MPNRHDMRHDTIDCPDVVRASLRWAVTQLRRQPVLFLPVVLWVGSGIGFSYLIFDVLRLVPNLRDPWTIPSLLAAVCMIWMGMLFQTRASLAVAAGEHLRPRTCARRLCRLWQLCCFCW